MTNLLQEYTLFNSSILPLIHLILYLAHLQFRAGSVFLTHSTNYTDEPG